MGKLMFSHCGISIFNKLFFSFQHCRNFKAFFSSKFPMLTRYCVAPEPVEISHDTLEKLTNFFWKNKNIVVLSGAGCSTESGIPDYRSPVHGSYTKGHKPTTYSEFSRSYAVRQRYWARNMIGWNFFNSRQPNRTHIYLAKMEQLGFINHIITQNVDTLHEMAGSQKVLHLHGNNREVVCINCRQVISREYFQQRLIDHNPHWYDYILKEFGSSSENVLQKMNRPDGDIELGHLNFSSFHVPSCENCGGILKPGVVMFGENVPLEISEKAKNIIRQANALLVLGTSLTTLSSYRLVLEAIERKLPTALINIGETRADSLVSFKIEAVLGDVLEKTFDLLNKKIHL